MVTHVFYSVKEAFLSLKRAGLMNFISMLTVTVTLLLIGVFLLLSENLEKRFRDNINFVELIAFLDEDTDTPLKLDGIRVQMARVAPGASVRYISRDTALREFRETLKEDAGLLDGVIENPLPDSFSIELEGARTSKDFIDTTVVRIGRIEGVADVIYPEEWLSTVDDVIRKIRLAERAVAVLFCLISFLVISNTIRLTVMGRRHHIEIMKLVGATYSFILRPFVLEGFLQGAIGGVLSLTALFGFYIGIRTRFPDVVFLSPFHTFGLVAFGALVGFFSGYIAARHYVKI